MTAWPIVFNFEPSSQDTPAMSLIQGDDATFTIQAIPDPNYPNSLPVPPLGGVVTLPPQPTITSITVSRGNGEYDPEQNIWQILSTSSAKVTVVSNDIFPFQEISLLLEDNSRRVFTTRAGVVNFYTTNNVKFLVTSCIPSDVRYVYKSLTVTATSDSTTTPTLTRTFWIRMESDFTKTQQFVKDLLVLSQPYITQLQNSNPPTVPYTPPAPVVSNRVSAKSTLTKPYNSAVNRNTLDLNDYVFDDIFRSENSAERIAELEAQTGKSIIELINDHLGSVEVNMAEGIINSNIVPLSDIALLLEKVSDDDCCGCLDEPEPPSDIAM